MLLLLLLLGVSCVTAAAAAVAKAFAAVLHECVYVPCVDVTQQLICFIQHQQRAAMQPQHTHPASHSTAQHSTTKHQCFSVNTQPMNPCLLLNTTSFSTCNCNCDAHNIVNRPAHAHWSGCSITSPSTIHIQSSLTKVLLQEPLAPLWVAELC